MKSARMLVLPLAVALVGAAQATPARQGRGPGCRLPRAVVQRIVNGYDPERSGEVQIVPVEGSYYGNHSHAGPWPFLQEVPLLLYGPGHVPATGRIARPVTLADVAPTIGRMIGYDFAAPDGAVMPEAVVEGAPPPKLVVTVVWDGGGRNVLRKHPKAWPTVRNLIPNGAWFEHATVASSPSTTPATHTTLGTGAFPDTHGLIDLVLRTDGNRIASVRRSLEFLKVPSLGDAYDVARGNQPLVGSVANGLTWGMLGHGSFLQGGDRDFALYHSDSGRWALAPPHQPYFTLPGYVNEVPGPKPRPHLADRPRFSAYETDVIAELIRREGFGDDDVPDLLFVNYKQIDKVGHRWSMNSPQMERAVRGSDRAIGQLMRVLDAEVGQGNWVLGLTADHGSSPDARASGAYEINTGALRADLTNRFGKGIDAVRATQIWLGKGAQARAVARFLTRYTEADNGGTGARKVFAAAVPSSSLRSC